MNSSAGCAMTCFTSDAPFITANIAVERTSYQLRTIPTDLRMPVHATPTTAIEPAYRGNLFVGVLTRRVKTSVRRRDAVLSYLVEARAELTRKINCDARSLRSYSKHSPFGRQYVFMTIPTRALRRCT
jgi:hypothetical protein